MEPKNHARHVRVQRALDQVNGISISRIYNDALAQNKGKSGGPTTFEERIEAIMQKTRDIAQHLQANNGRISSIDIENEEDEEESIDDFSIMDDDAHASNGFTRQLSRFLSLPRSLSQREMEEITSMVLHEVNNTPDHSILMHEIGSLIDEHVLTPRSDDDIDSDSGTNSIHHRDSLSKRRQKDLPKLDIHPVTDIEMAQRRIFKSANRLNSVSFRGGFDDSHATGLRMMASKATMRSLFGREDGGSMLGLTRSPSCRSPKIHMSISKAEQEALDLAAKEEVWRAQVKEDYIMWLRAKAEAEEIREKARKDERMQRKKKKPRWLLLYEQGRLHQQHLDEQIAARK